MCSWKGIIPVCASVLKAQLRCKKGGVVQTIILKIYETGTISAREFVSNDIEGIMIKYNKSPMTRLNLKVHLTTIIYK